MPKFTLLATREACDTIELGSREWDNVSLAQAWAEGRVEGMEGDAASWPCGYDAVLSMTVAGYSKFWVLTDGWEEGLGTLEG